MLLLNKQLLLILVCLCSLHSFANCNSSISTPDSISDGPYIFRINDTLKIKWINKSTLKETIISQKSCNAIMSKFHITCNYEDLKSVFSKKTDYIQKFTNVDSIVAISDIHGNYRSYIKLLIANGIIDNELKWKFGKGHLVVIGDAFDRGDQVTEILWHLFELEQQAAMAGGMVHVLLGNHESMIFNGDLRYVNEKYKKVESITNVKYNDIYAENSVLGKWLRSKPIIITINNTIFVHAGISTDFIHKALAFENVNKVFSENIWGIDKKIIIKNEELNFLTGKKGPLWYRGYFNDSTFSENKIDSILNFYDKKNIIVGHTTNNEIKTCYHNKIIDIDAGLGYEQPGEVLIYKNGTFYKGTNSGLRTKL